MQELNPYNGVTPTLHRPVFIFHKKNIYMDLYNGFCFRFKVKNNILMTLEYSYIMDVL